MRVIVRCQWNPSCLPAAQAEACQQHRSQGPSLPLCQAYLMSGQASARRKYMKSREDKKVCVCFCSLNGKWFQLFPASGKGKASFLQPWGNVIWSGPAASFSASRLAGACSGGSGGSGHTQPLGLPRVPPGTPTTRVPAAPALRRGRNQSREYGADLPS